MEFEQLPSLWQVGGASTDAPSTPEALLAEVKERSERLAHTVRRRDRLETFLALIMAPVFVACAFTGARPLARIGAVVLALSCLAIPLRLRSARRGFLPAMPDQSVRTFLQDERARVVAQMRLLSTVLWWYLLPLGTGVVLFVAGGSRSWAVGTVYALVVVALYSWIHRLNQRAVAAELAPRLAELQVMLDALGPHTSDEARPVA